VSRVARVSVSRRVQEYASHPVQQRLKQRRPEISDYGLYL
jgi:hypothetical protein